MTHSSVESLALIDVFEHVCDTIPLALLSPKGRQRVEDVARTLPPFSGLTGLEFRLFANNTQVDLGISYRQFQAIHLASYLENAVASNPIYSHIGWQKILAFANCWNPQSDAASINFITIEIDIPEHAPVATVPMVSFFTESPYPYTDVPAAMLHILNGFQNPATAQTRLQQLRPYLAALLPGDVWRGIGLMTNRDFDGVRLLLSFDAKRVLPYLHMVGWQGDETEIQSALTELSVIGRPVNLYLDVGVTLGKRIGVGTLLVGSKMPMFNGYSNMMPMFDSLAAQGLCTVEKAKAVKSLHKRPINAANTQRPWPRYLLQETARQHPLAMTSQFLHTACGIKISYTGQTPPEAKIYTCITHHWY